ncbi:MAG TPA: efflux transporter outer membrane subunit [Oculatellaceae cyanobacterium]|jgi:multidrug efflux system outer membrane protein
MITRRSAGFLLQLAGVFLLAGSIQVGTTVYAKKIPPGDPPPIRGEAVWQETLEPDTTDTLQFAPGFPDKDWWLQFGDRYLTGYINQALKANPDIETASLRVAEAQTLVRQSLAREFPQITLGPNYTRQHNSENMVNFDTSRSGNSFMSPTIIEPGSAFNLFTVPLQANYELDLWGKKRSQTKANRKQHEAITQQQRAVLLSVVSEVASAYLNLLRTDELIHLTRQLIDKHEDLVEIRESQWKNGLIAKDVLLATQQDLEENKALLSDLLKQQALFIHQLCVLTGRPPQTESHLERGTLAELKLPPEIPAGEPAQLVQRRPDVLAQEAELERARIEVSLARKAYLPDIRLTGQFGFGSLKLSNLMNWDSMLASVGGGLAQIIFDAGEQKARYKMMRSRHQQQLQQYRKVILNSFLEVENSLASLKRDHQALSHAEKLACLNEEAVELVHNKGNAGLVPQLDVIQAQAEALTIQQQVTQKKTDTLIDLVSLYKALGGGF